MTSLNEIYASWKQDHSLRRVIKNSSYLFGSNTISIPLTAIQSILAARTLGAASYGVLGVIISYVTNINRLLSFRMGEPVVRYMGEYVTQGRNERAAAVVKAAAITEAVTSLVTYLFLFLLAPLIATFFVKDSSSVHLIYLYGLMLVANLIPETATGILQVGGNFRSQATINLVQNLVTCIGLGWAFVIHGGLWSVLFAYFLGKIIYGSSMTVYAFYRAGKMLGHGWWQTSFKYLPEGMGFWKFAASTNLSGTINLFTRDSEELWLAWFLNPTFVGYYKTAKAVMNLMLLPITPFISTTYPEINQTIAKKAWAQLRSLLKRLTWMTAIWNGLVILVVALLGSWLIPLVYGSDFGPAYPAALILLVGYGVANILYWNRNLLLSLGRPNYALGVIAIVGALKIGLSFLLVPHYGYLMQAALLSGFLAISVVAITWRGLVLVKQRSALPESI